MNGDLQGDAGEEQKPAVEAKDELLEALKEKFSAVVLNTKAYGERRLEATVRKESAIDVCKYLKEAGFDHLSSLSGVDYADRFEVVYHLWSYSKKKIVSLKVQLEKTTPAVKSVTALWKSADWHEREAFDLFGIKFEGHPNLTRIFLEDFNGHPLRKDYKTQENPWYEREARA